MVNKKWRFYRLSPNLKFLHYSDFLEKTFIRDGIEDLPERSKLIVLNIWFVFLKKNKITNDFFLLKFYLLILVDLSLVTDIMTGPSPHTGITT
jgi:hypothetical protein